MLPPVIVSRIMKLKPMTKNRSALPTRGLPLVFGGQLDFLLAVASHWLAGIVTTGAAPLTPVSAIENNSITMPNVVLD
jgi:hypothetical protein